MPQPKILPATAKTQCRHINKYVLKNYEECLRSNEHEVLLKPQGEENIPGESHRRHGSEGPETVGSYSRIQVPALPAISW